MEPIQRHLSPSRGVFARDVTTTLFLYIFDWPTDGQTHCSWSSDEVTSVTMEDRETLPFKASAEAVFIKLPDKRPDSLIPMVTVKLGGAIKVNLEDFVLDNCYNQLNTGLAILTNCQTTNVDWMEKFGDWKHADCLGGWCGPDSSATWNFRTLQPESFYIDVEYSCPASDDYSEWRLRCGATNLTFPLIDTGERPKREAFDDTLPRFRTYRIGMVDFPKPGAQRLTINPTGIMGKNIRIASLKLIPIN